MANIDTKDAWWNGLTKAQKDRVYSGDQPPQDVWWKSMAGPDKLAVIDRWSEIFKADKPAPKPIVAPPKPAPVIAPKPVPAPAPVPAMPAPVVPPPQPKPIIIPKPYDIPAPKIEMAGKEIIDVVEATPDPAPAPEQAPARYTPEVLGWKAPKEEDKPAQVETTVPEPEPLQVLEEMPDIPTIQADGAIPDFSKMNVPTLRKYAKQRKIKTVGRRKADIVSDLEAAFNLP